MQYLAIEYHDPENQLAPLEVRYKLRHNPIVDKWAKCLRSAQKQYQIDDPARFYGFGTIESQCEKSLSLINECIDNINIRQSLVARRPESVHDQDCLNYLHHIFEVHHGLLDKTPNSDEILRSHLCNLNVLVHRCESVARGASPRHVVTYFGLPKTKILDLEDYSYAVHTWDPGTVFLNYVEIGKTIEDLALDNDQYIGAGAFQPFRHYSADFVVRFYARTARQAQQRHDIIYRYYQQHREALAPWQTCYTNGQFPIADLETDIDLEEIAKRQFVAKVQLI